MTSKAEVQTSPGSSPSDQATSETKASPDAEKVAVNLGWLGHIDSGKTSLCRALSTVTSTASLDKHPQSQQRGITLDLGFTSFSTETPEHWGCPAGSELQFCLVDCPGHASLIKTVLGGANIIDMCCLVVDAQKGMQTQSAECLVVAELLTDQLIVVVNKIDMLPESERKDALDKLVRKLRNTVAKTRFGTEKVAFCCVSALSRIGLEELIATIHRHLRRPQRVSSGPLLFSFDHVFPIKGQGTVMTGTLLRGSVKPGALVDIPVLGEEGRGKKVRSLQIFKKSAKSAKQGDRVAMCVPQVNAALLERGLVVDPKSPLPRVTGMIAVVERLPYFKMDVLSKSKFHLTVGHQTVMAKAFFFCPQVLFPRPEKKDMALFEAQTRASGACAVAASSTVRSGNGGRHNLNTLGQGVLVNAKISQWPRSFDRYRTYVHLDQAFNAKNEVVISYLDGEEVTLVVKKKAQTAVCSKPSVADAAPSSEHVPASDTNSGGATPSASSRAGSALAAQGTPSTITTTPKSLGDASFSPPDRATKVSAAHATKTDSGRGAGEPSSCIELQARGTSRDVTEIVYVNGRLCDQDRQPLKIGTEVEAYVPVRKKDEILYQLFYLCRGAEVPLRFQNDDGISNGLMLVNPADPAAGEFGEDTSENAPVVEADEPDDTEKKKKKSTTGDADDDDKKKKKKSKKSSEINFDDNIEEYDEARIDAELALLEAELAAKKKKKKKKSKKKGDSSDESEDGSDVEGMDADAKKKTSSKAPSPQLDDARESANEATTSSATFAANLVKPMIAGAASTSSSGPSSNVSSTFPKNVKGLNVLDEEYGSTPESIERIKALPEYFHLAGRDRERAVPVCYAYLDLEQSMQIPDNSLLIGSKLDFDAHSPHCRIAFFGKMLAYYDSTASMPQLIVSNPETSSSSSSLAGGSAATTPSASSSSASHFAATGPVIAGGGSNVGLDGLIDIVKMREKVGQLEYLKERQTYTVKDMFKKDTDLSLFLNLRVIHEASGSIGVIESAYGTEGNVRVRFERDLPVSVDLKRDGLIENADGPQGRVLLHFKKIEAKHVNAKNKIIQ